MYCIFLSAAADINMKSLAPTNSSLQTTQLRTRQFVSRINKLGKIPHHVLIFDLYNKRDQTYRAFCAGSIITEERVLTSANCFLTNRKRYLRNLSRVRVVAGVLTTIVSAPASRDTDTQQWRSIKNVHSQKYFKFPAYDLAVLVTKEPWNLNKYVKKIPYAFKNQNFDGVCSSASVKATTSWSMKKTVFLEKLQLIEKSSCDRILLRNTRLYYCTVSLDKQMYKLSEIQGAGLVCHTTGDPDEVDQNQGILVGVTSLVNTGHPSLHSRVGLFNKWVSDDSHQLNSDQAMLVIALLIKLL